MKEFKGYESYNDRRSIVLEQLHTLFDMYNKHKAGSGYDLEGEILDEHDVITLSDLSTSTLINTYNSIMNGDTSRGDKSRGDKNGSSNKDSLT